MQQLQKAIFLDRDGVIIHNRAHYVRAWQDVKNYPFALPALRKIASTRFKVIVITNQSPIGRGILASSTVEQINVRLREIVHQIGGRIDQFYICPHTPEDQCDCRKPAPGLILQAQKDLALNLADSWIIGDAYSDLLAGENAGVRHKILVSTGRGKKQLVKHAAEIAKLDIEYAQNLWNAVNNICAAIPSY